MNAIASPSVIDAFFLCLAASLIWAPFVFAGASVLTREARGNAEAAVWPSALFIASLPVLAAPLAASLGLSLRTPKPLPPMAAPETAAAPTLAPITAAAENGAAIELATIFNAAADLYFYGFVLFAALGILRLVGFSYRIRYSFPVDDKRLMNGLHQWRQSIGVRSPVRFAYSDAVSSVCVHGFIRPVILMPPLLLERVSTEDAILMGAHELAHVKRGDTWLFALCGLAKALFWFNPFMRRIVAHAQLAAEQAADAIVIRAGANRKSYARCFVESLKISAGLGNPQHALVPSFTPFDKRSRRERLDAILSGAARTPVITLGGKAVLIASGLLALILAFGQAALAVAPPPAKDALTVVPVDGRITSTFGERIDPISKETRFHQGMDIAAPTGTPVRAAGDGKVIDATSRYNGSDAWGNVVVIDHGHGLVTRYAQLDSYIVRKGETVDAGDTIGAVGATGRATGPHLHFEVLNDGENIDPAPLVVPDAPIAPAPRAFKKVQLAPTAPGVTIAAPPTAPSAPVKPEPTPDITIDVPPAPEPMPAPPAPPEPDQLSFGERLELRLAGRFDDYDWNGAFTWADGENGVAMRFAEIDEEEFEDLRALMKELKSTDFSQQNWSDIAKSFPQFSFVLDGVEISNEDRKAIERARVKAMRTAERVQRDTARRLAEVERAMARADRERERAMFQIERAQKNTADNARELERMEDVLALRERALREAQEEIARERAELERMRAELREQNRNED